MTDVFSIAGTPEEKSFYPETLKHALLPMPTLLNI